MANLVEIDVNQIKDLEEAKSIIVLLLDRMKYLEERIAVLEKNSSNSSKPPSSDIVNPRKNRSKKTRSNRGNSNKSKFKQSFSESEVDEVKELYLSDCPDCLIGLTEEYHKEVKVSQNAELVENPVEVTEYRRHGRYCSCCGKYVYPELPEGVLEKQLFGPKLQALIGYMKANLGSSYLELQQYAQDVLGIKMSQGMLVKIVSRVSSSIEPAYEELKEAVPKQESLNIDETGWKEQGKKLWAWVFCNQTIAFFTIRDSRASKVLREVLGETFSGAIMSDFYSAYVSYANPRQQFCLAHLIRDIKFLTTLPDKEDKEFGRKVLQFFKVIFRLWHRRATYPPGELEKKADLVKRKLFTLLINSNLEKGKALTLKKRLIKHWDKLFRFFEEPYVFAPTNNHAEQTLRHLVRVRKLTQGSRGINGRIWNARAMTVIETCRKQKRNPWEFFQNSVNSLFFSSNSTSLLHT